MEKLKYGILFVPYLFAAFIILSKEALVKKWGGVCYKRKVKREEKERARNIQHITPVRKPF